MSKKERKIEINLKDSSVVVDQMSLEGYALTAGNKVIGEITEIDGKFAVVKDGAVLSFHKTLDLAIQQVIETFNLNH